LYLSQYRSGTRPSEDLESLLFDARQFGVEADKLFEKQDEPRLSISDVRRELLSVPLTSQEEAG
jgi:transcriptional regulator with XRE-family HTH domain